MILDKVSSDALPIRITDIDKELIVKGVGLIEKKEYEKRYQQQAATIWFTGLHGSGKNELAYSLQKSLFDMGAHVVLLDGKSTRSGLSRELDYSPSDRAEHLRRVAYISKLLNQQGIIVICSFISPGESIRLQAKEIIGRDQFHLVYLNADIDYCRKNDQYKLYDLIEEGSIKYLPGVDVDYDPPANPEITVTPEEKNTGVEKILSYLAEKKIFPL
jgi:bifunctional enzyme CysN/CysC